VFHEPLGPQVPDNAEKPHDPPRADVFALETDTDQDSDGGGFLEGEVTVDVTQARL